MKLSLSILIELLLGVSSLVAQVSAPMVAAPEPLVAVFATGAMVRSDGVFSTDLIQGIPALPRVRVAPAPQVGAWSQLSRTSVVEALRIAGVDLSVVRWTGPESARISRAMRELGEAEVRDQITQELQRRFARNGGEIEVRLSRPWRSVSIPDESLDIRLLDLPTAGLLSWISLKVEGLVGGDAVGSWFQPIQVRHWCEVPVAAAALRRGQPLVEVETVLERRDVLVSRGILKALPKAVQDYELAEGLAPGQAFSDRTLRLKTVVFRGRRVDARIQAGTLEITTKVEALEDGYPGQSIRVRNPLSKREFRGIVQSEDSVLVPL
jgi:flagella basal body P-ring formation protein FlgA